MVLRPTSLPESSVNSETNLPSPSVVDSGTSLTSIENYILQQYNIDVTPSTQSPLPAEDIPETPNVNTIAPLIPVDIPPLPYAPSPTPLPNDPSPAPLPNAPSPAPLPNAPSPTPLPNAASPAPLPRAPSPTPLPNAHSATVLHGRSALRMPSLRNIMFENVATVLPQSTHASPPGSPIENPAHANLRHHFIYYGENNDGRNVRAVYSDDSLSADDSDELTVGEDDEGFNFEEYNNLVDEMIRAIEGLEHINTSNTLDSDRADHPVLYTMVNVTLWMLMITFVVLPLAFLSSIAMVFVTILEVMYPADVIKEISDILDLTQNMPAICLQQMMFNGDFINFLDIDIDSDV